MDIFVILEPGIWSGVAALGFGVLFNVPPRSLLAIGLLGFVGGLTKFTALAFDINIILASLAGAFFIGVLSIPLAHKIHVPPLIFSIPAVIPMVPGTFAYRMMLGLMEISAHTDKTGMEVVLIDVVQNALKVVFILFALAVGIAGPMLITRKDSAKQMKLPK